MGEDVPKNPVHDDYSEESDADTDFECDCVFGFHVINDLADYYAAQEIMRAGRKTNRRRDAK